METYNNFVAICLAFVFILIDGTDSMQQQNHHRIQRQVQQLRARTFNLRRRCPPNVRLMLGARRIDVENLRLSFSEASQVTRVLYGRPFEERAEVICAKANRALEILASLGKQRGSVITVDIRNDKPFQGDIILTPRTSASFFPSVAPPAPPAAQGQTTAGGLGNTSPTRPSSRRQVRQKRKAHLNMWPNAVIPYVINLDDFTTESHRAIIRNGIAEWEQKTCIRMPLRTTETDYVKFIRDKGCTSFLGRVGGLQDISIDEGCEFLGIVIHEIGHAIGISHEQSREDRDRYVTIDFNSVDPNSIYNFEKLKAGDTMTKNVPYDFSSIMHYAAKDFSTSNSNVVQPKEVAWTKGIGQREDLSFFDAKLVNMIYCNGQCAGGLESTTCMHEGYLDPNNCGQCVCPPGFAPPTCAQPVSSAPACGQTRLTATIGQNVFSSVNYDTYQGLTNADCYYVVDAPVGHQIILHFVDQFQIQYKDDECKAFVEVRYQSTVLAGPRFCGTTSPGSFISHGNRVIIRLKTKEQSTKGFRFTYEAVPCGGCAANSASSETACLRTTIFPCNQGNSVNRCFDPLPDSPSKRFCCSGYTLSGTTCIQQDPPTTTTTRPDLSAETTTTTDFLLTTELPPMPTETTTTDFLF